MRSQIQNFDTNNHDDSEDVIDNTTDGTGTTFDEFKFDVILRPGNFFIAVRSVTTSSEIWHLLKMLRSV